MHIQFEIRQHYLSNEPSLNPFEPKLTGLLAFKSPHHPPTQITTIRVLQQSH